MNDINDEKGVIIPVSLTDVITSIVSEDYDNETLCDIALSISGDDEEEYQLTLLKNICINYIENNREESELKHLMNKILEFL